MRIFDNIDAYKENTAVIWEDKEISYDMLVSQSDELAKNIGERCLVFVVCSNVYPSLLGYVSFLRNGIVPLMVNHSMNKEMFENLVNTYKPAYIWQPDGFYDGEKTYELYGYELIKCSNERYDINDDLALLLTTSGSTGSPKYVRQTYANILCNAKSIIEYLEIVSTDRAITTLPMSYTYGLSIINTHLMQGASIVLTEATIMQREFMGLITKYNVNNFGGVPYTYEILKKMRFERWDVPSMRYITQAGGKLGKELHEEFANICLQKGIKLIVMYGQTEATARMSWLPWEKTLEKAGSIGIAIPGGRFSIIDVNGELIEQSDCVGELVYNGGNVTMGYALSWEDLNLGDERNGMLETGDMAYVDKDGYYYIAGRKKRFLKVYGNRVNLDELDGMLRSAGYDAVAAGEDNHVKVFSVNGKAEEIAMFLAKKTSINIRAFEIIHIEEIPRSESGKVLYSKLQ